jgi:hypothetical protein
MRQGIELPQEQFTHKKTEDQSGQQKEVVVSPVVWCGHEGKGVAITNP